MEIYKKSATSSPLHILSSSDLLVFTSSHLHIFSSSHHPILTSSPLHIFSYRIFTCSHPLIFTIFTTSHPHILSSSLIFKSSPLHIFSSSNLHIFTCSHLPLLPFCRLALLPSFLFSLEGGVQGQCQRGRKIQPFRTKMKFDPQKLGQIAICTLSGEMCVKGFVCKKLLCVKASMCKSLCVCKSVSG